LGALGESSAEFVAPATDRFVRDHDTTLEQQLFDVAQAQAEPKIPSFYRRLPINLTQPQRRLSYSTAGYATLKFSRALAHARRKDVRAF
jgi:hypothetical protein